MSLHLESSASQWGHITSPLNLSGPFTLASWIYIDPNNHGAWTSAKIMEVYSYPDELSCDIAGTDDRGTTYPYLRMSIRQDEPRVRVTAYEISSAGWYYLALRHDGSGYVDLSISGSTVLESSTMGATFSTTGNGDIVVGSWYFGASYFTGDIYSFDFWNSYLSLSQLATEMTHGPGASYTTGLYETWDFAFGGDLVTGNTNSHVMTLVGSPTQSADPEYNPGGPAPGPTRRFFIIH